MRRIVLVVVALIIIVLLLTVGFFTASYFFSQGLVMEATPVPTRTVHTDESIVTGQGGINTLPSITAGDYECALTFSDTRYDTGAAFIASNAIRIDALTIDNQVTSLASTTKSITFLGASSSAGEVDTLPYFLQEVVLYICHPWQVDWSVFDL